MEERPILGITMGDPASIGPELCIKALSKRALYETCRPVIVGESTVLQQAISILGMEEHIKLHSITEMEHALFTYGTIDVYEIHVLEGKTVPLGEVSPLAGEVAFQCVKTVIELALAGKVDATVTNALHKEAMNLAGHTYAGHTEIYADLTHTKQYSMLLAHENLKVVHISTHVSLREACDRVKKERVLEVIGIAQKACVALGIAKPRIGVAGLNPHCGEGGLFGKEEIEEITPAIEAAKREGIQAIGPIPPDTIFSKARGGWYDIVVAMYHDQGHIPLKLVGFVYDKEKQVWDSVAGVNITLGLPIIRTSVDHGTAFDQAGKGTANEISLENAIAYGILLAKHRKKV